ncbi:histidine phosphatase superfamily [Filobasidium floriforme]|uniref:histidine phosphatase superfamily n=1 Tax=Filobasidium floriforme TaxID=5210 RepID=UPI001E8D7C90|nr:histidine phosphatase superfamily [Filobasidium floriforme]KAH8082350.1 histidine phosphatase superfamily [Filobasidium floriforme]
MSYDINPTNGSKVIGAVIITRHGDRSGYYQDPKSYAASDTTITPLGSAQTYQSGIQFREKYLVNDSSSAVAGVDWPLINLSEVDFMADASEGQVIVDSALSFAQGFFPANLAAGTAMLANGTPIASPLGGYIYVPVTTVEADEEIALEGFTSCPAFVTRTNEVYKSSAFQAKAAEQKEYLDSLVSLLDGRAVTLENMYNVFDYMNVQNIHNATFRDVVSDGGKSDYIMRNSRYLADYHEQAIFTDPDVDGIGNIAGQTIIPPILDALQQIANESMPLKLQYIGIAYKPFLSLFNMTQSGIDGMVSYASALAIEVRNGTDGMTVSMNFRNGSAKTDDNIGADNPFNPVPLFGRDETEIPLQTFIDTLKPHGISELSTWCTRCGNTNSRGCELLGSDGSSSSSDYASITSTSGRQHVSPVVAGVIGALVGIVVAGILFAALGLWGNKKGRGSGSGYVGGKRPERETSYAGDTSYEMEEPSDGRKGGVEI